MATLLRTFGLAVVSKGQGPVCALLRQFHEQLVKDKEAAAKGNKQTDNKDGQQDTESKPGSETAAPVQPEFVVGEVVKTISSIHKDRLRDKKAKVVQVLSKECRVEFLEGEARGEIKDFPKARLTKFAESPKRSPAGDPAPESAKRARAEALFGADADMI